MVQRSADFGRLMVVDVDDDTSVYDDFERDFEVAASAAGTASAIVAAIAAAIRMNVRIFPPWPARPARQELRARNIYARAAAGARSCIDIG
ncbi:MAG: hypothetical protein KGP27_00510 [Hyphomicrobiales bacterium]|nr:hypothetical protein [Hyphomicrobiales bacterium]